MRAGDSRAEFSFAQANSGRDEQTRFLAAKRAYLPKMVPVPCSVVKEVPGRLSLSESTSLEGLIDTEFEEQMRQHAQAAASQFLEEQVQKIEEAGESLLCLYVASAPLQGFPR